MEKRTNAVPTLDETESLVFETQKRREYSRFDRVKILDELQLIASQNATLTHDLSGSVVREKLALERKIEDLIERLARGIG